jgi:hypothetical protein
VRVTPDARRLVQIELSDAVGGRPSRSWYARSTNRADWLCAGGTVVVVVGGRVVVVVGGRVVVVVAGTVVVVVGGRVVVVVGGMVVVVGGRVVVVVGGMVVVVVGEVPPPARNAELATFQWVAR